MWKKLLIYSLLSSSTVFAGRIDRLLPTCSDALAIEPALPDNFVMGSFQLPANLYAGVIWGTQRDLDTLFADPNHISSTYIFVSFSGDIVQNSPHNFLNEMYLCDKLQNMGFTEIEIKKDIWGDYPVLNAKFLDRDNRESHLAWVGLNAAQGGWVLMFSFQYPDTQEKPTADQLIIWSDFLSKSTPLTNDALQR